MIERLDRAQQSGSDFFHGGNHTPPGDRSKGRFGFHERIVRIRSVIGQMIETVLRVRLDSSPIPCGGAMSNSLAPFIPRLREGSRTDFCRTGA
jgi:hypothetical protein